MVDYVPLPAMDELLLDYAMPDDGVPSEYRGMMIEGESAEKFTERMRRRYRALKHMQMDSVKPSNLRSFPDMLEKEIEELNQLEAAGSEAVKWLDVQA